MIVTHNIEEAVFLADRVILLGSNPEHVRGEIVIDLPRPHDRTSDRFKALVDYIYTVMTNPEAEVTGTVSVAAPKAPQPSRSPYSRPLPHVRVGGHQWSAGIIALLSL